MEDCVILREFGTACGRRFGHATLNAPKSLNALSLEMIDRLAPQLAAWETDPDIVGVVLDGSGDKAFCAGGDVAALYRAIRAVPEGTVAAEVAAFFEREYRLDHHIHRYRKPILCWGNGIVMGGGIGLMAGASHRVATPSTRMAMPEITLGLYPDVGGSWFLRRMPGKLGLFLALTGAPLNAGDACFGGLADFVIAHESKERVLGLLADSRWDAPLEPAGTQRNHDRLGGLLDALAIAGARDNAPLRQGLDRIDSLIGHDGLQAIAGRLAAVAEEGEGEGREPAWLTSAARSFVRGAPSSAWLAWALWQRVPRLSLAEVFRLEYLVSVACATRGEFAEGVRALLIDKDRNPRWSHASVAEVGPADVEDHFRPRFSGPHPLADLA